MLLLQNCSLPRFHVTDGQNTRDQITRVEGRKAHDQIAFCALHSFLMAVQMNAGYIRCMRNNNLDITIVGSSCRLQQDSCP